MSFASDQDHAGGGLSPTSVKMLELRDAVFRQWERSVRETLPMAECIEFPILVNTLPSFYDNIAQAVAGSYPRSSGSERTSITTEHGGERARMTSYNHDALISEYQLFRTAIFHVLEANEVRLSRAEASIIHSSIDAGIKDAVNGFSLVQSALRERFAAALTHDMRNPLGVAMSAIDLSLRSGNSDTARQYLTKAKAGLGRIDQMIEQLLNTLTLVGGQRLEIRHSCFDLLALVREIAAEWDDGARSQLIVTGKSVSGWWGRDEMKRAVENLIRNAFKYGREGGVVTVKVVETYGRAMLSVHNHGEPIPVEEQECIFQMYRRAESAASSGVAGWGIGLPYVRAVAEAHGGSIGVDSAAERGTTFMLDVPLDPRIANSA